MHVRKCGDWTFDGLALLENASKDAVNYFEEMEIRLFGKFCQNVIVLFLMFLGANFNNVMQIANERLPIRKHPNTLGSIDDDLKAVSFLLLSALYCKTDYYVVDMRPVSFFKYPETICFIYF